MIYKERYYFENIGTVTIFMRETKKHPEKNKSTVFAGSRRPTAMQMKTFELAHAK
jgi:hypothetical protein